MCKSSFRLGSGAEAADVW